MRGYRLIRNARSLRRDPTRAESILWRYLRDRRFLHVKFRRQHAIGGYIPDFYCCELKRAIELDGRGHELEAAYDIERDGELSKLGVTVLRIRNEDLYRDGDAVAMRIEWAIARLRR